MAKRWILVLVIGLCVCLPGCKSNRSETSDSTAPLASTPLKPTPSVTRDEHSQPINASTTPTPAPQPVVTQNNDPVIAHLNGRPIPLSQIQKPLIEGYGLNILLNIIQLDLAKQEAQRANVVVSAEDIKKEREQTLAKMFQDADKSDYESLFDQFLQQQHISKAEFNLVLETNAYLRKVAEPMVKGQINDAALQEAFRQLYGETVRVRHIQLSNMQEVLEAKRRLAAGEAFEKIAMEMSRNARTAGLGGELPPFSRQAGGYPQAFKDAAFALKEGEVSDAVQADGAFHLIKLEQRIAPKAVKFEDVKESLREDLLERLVQATIKQLRGQLASDAIKGLVIDEPVLKEQYDAKIRQRDQQITDKNQIRQQFEKERQRILERAATQPGIGTTTSTQPASSTNILPEATQPQATSPAPEVARPPATQSGAAATGGTSDTPATRP